MLDDADKKEVRKIVREEVINEIAPLKKSQKRMEKKLDTMIKFFDREHLSLEKRVRRIETHLKLPTIG